MRSSIYLILALTVLGPISAAAQTAVSGDVSGRVLTSTGQSVPDAVVTLRSFQLDITRATTTDMQGAYSITFLTPGRYEMRVEAFGYRPVVYPVVQVEAGTSHTLMVRLTASPPPVTQVDTVRLGGVPYSRWSSRGASVSASDLDAHRDLLGGWTSLARSFSGLDPSLGSQGLPGVMTAQVVDGVPFFPARHPYLRGESSGSPAFPAYLLSHATVLQEPEDVLWLGSAGTTLAADTRTGMGSGSGGVEGAWSGDQLWSAGDTGFGSPVSLTSYRAAVHGGLDIVPDTSRLYVAGEVLSQQTALPSRILPSQRSSLQGLDPTILEQLSSASVETVDRFSGMARLDHWGETSRFTLRAAAGHETQSYDGSGPGSLEYGLGLPETATDLSATGTLISLFDQGFELEVLGGLSMSDRTYGDATAPPAATLVGPGRSLGEAPGSPAKVSRVDVYLAPAMHFPLGSGKIKAGLTIHATSHTFDQTFAADGDVFFSDGAGLNAGEGVYTRGTSPESTFSTSRLGLFAQYAWDATPGLRITAGARADWERIPTSDVKLDTAWARVSGTANNEYRSRLVQPGGVIAATWDPRGDQRTVLFGTGSVMNGVFDPSLEHEAIAQDGAAKIRRYVGSGISWPDVANGPQGTQSRTILTLLGPDTRAPLTYALGGGIVQDLGAGWVVHASASARRTDFLPRRRNLNLPAYPLAQDANGRDVFGELEKFGSLVAPAMGSNLRFADFGPVWAVDPDGWSKYRGVSFGLEYATRRADAFVSYTRSHTTDNWIGASRGLPDATLDPHLPEVAGSTWAEGTSDFDVPDRLVAGGRARFDVAAGIELAASYTFESGRPFTPGYRAGVDANGDGSARNDVAWIPDVSQLGDLASAWPCLADQAGGFAARNSCRGPTRSTLNAGLRLGLVAIGGRAVSVTVQGFDLLKDATGLVDSALLLVDPSSPITRSADGSVVTVPTTVNPDFGKVIFPSLPGRIVRIGIRIGG